MAHFRQGHSFKMNPETRKIIETIYRFIFKHNGYITAIIPNGNNSYALKITFYFRAKSNVLTKEDYYFLLGDNQDIKNFNRPGVIYGIINGGLDMCVKDYTGCCVRMDLQF